MTHSILMTVKLKDYEDVKEIRTRILEKDNDSWMTMLGLTKVPKDRYYPDIQTSAGLPPFICFPEEKEKDEDDGFYHIIIESGSHCDYYDTKESFMMWVSWFLFIQEINSYCIEFKYGIGQDGENGTLNLKQALKKIVFDSELEKYIKV